MLIPGNVTKWCYQLNWKAEYKDCVLTAVCCVCHSEWHPPVPPAGAECVWDSPGWGHCSSGPDPAQPDRGRCCRWQGQHGDRRRLPGEAQGPARWGKGLLICSAVLALLSRQKFHDAWTAFLYSPLPSEEVSAVSVSELSWLTSVWEVGCCCLFFGCALKKTFSWVLIQPRGVQSIMWGIPGAFICDFENVWTLGGVSKCFWDFSWYSPVPTYLSLSLQVCVLGLHLAKELCEVDEDGDYWLQITRKVPVLPTIFAALEISLRVKQNLHFTEASLHLLLTLARTQQVRDAEKWVHGCAL